MRKLFAAILVGFLAMGLAPLALADHEQGFTEDSGQVPKDFAKKITQPGPVIPPLPNPPVLGPGFKFRPFSMTRENPRLESIRSSQGLESGTRLSQRLESSAASLSSRPGGGSARSLEQDARRSLKRLIRQLG